MRSPGVTRVIVRFSAVGPAGLPPALARNPTSKAPSFPPERHKLLILPGAAVRSELCGGGGENASEAVAAKRVSATRMVQVEPPYFLVEVEPSMNLSYFFKQDKLSRRLFASRPPCGREVPSKTIKVTVLDMF